MKKSVEIEAYCSACKKVTTQDATYVGKFLRDRKCKECGAIESGDKGKLLKAYADDMVDRVLTKPYRLRKEWQEKRGDMLHSLPGRILRRPFREVDQLSDMLGESKEPEKDTNSKDKDSPEGK